MDVIRSIGYTMFGELLPCT